MIEISKASPVHVKVLSALHTACFDTSWTAQAFADLLTLPGMICLIAQRETELLGFILAQTTGAEAEIITVCVLPEFRNQGIAARLLKQTVVSISGLEKLFIEVDETNTGAVAFYNKSGFAQTATRKNYYAHKDGTRSNALMMVLAPPARS